MARGIGAPTDLSWQAATLTRRSAEHLDEPGTSPSPIAESQRLEIRDRDQTQRQTPWVLPALPGARHDIGAVREPAHIDALAVAGIRVIADSAYRGAGANVEVPLPGVPW